MNTRSHVVTLALVVIAAAGAFAAYRIGVTEGMKRQPAFAETSSSQPGGSTTRVDANEGKRILYWHDPMVPGQKFDKPGKSPYMDMQLVPVYADGAADDQRSVAIDPRVQQNLGVRTAAVTRAPLTMRVDAVGSVVYNERDVAVVQARSQGFLERLHVRAPLDTVRSGQPLAEIYVPDWVAAQEEYLSASRISRTDPDSYAGLVDAARQRMRLAGMSDAQIARVESSGVVQLRTTLVAPLGGVVTELAAREGMTVMPGAPLFRINGLGTVWVNAEVPEALAAHVRRGARVQATATALPGVTFTGTVSAILPEVNATTRTLKARVELANPGGRLVPGMFANVEFTPQKGRDALLVPSEAVIHTGKRTVVIVASADGTFAPSDVEIGTESDGRTEIRKGLVQGQKVVISGQFLIDSEASLRGAANRMGGAADQRAADDATPVTASPPAEIAHDHGSPPAEIAHDHGSPPAEIAHDPASPDAGAKR